MYEWENWWLRVLQLSGLASLLQHGHASLLVHPLLRWQQLSVWQKEENRMFLWFLSEQQSIDECCSHPCSKNTPSMLT